MRLKKTLVSSIAALALMVSVMVPAALAQSQPAGTTTATVELTDAGEFDINFCGAVAFDSVGVTSSGEDEVSSGAVEICYLDTESWRPGFKLTLEASDFAYSGTATWNNDQTPSIPAENFTLGTMYNPYQGQWDSVAGVDVGDIGAWAGPTSQQVTKHEERSGAIPAGYTTYDQPADLAIARPIAYAWDGAGTGSGTLMPPSGSPHASADLITIPPTVDGTYQVFAVQLEVPAGLPSGSYTSNLTLTYIPGEGYPS